MPANRFCLYSASGPCSVVMPCSQGSLAAACLSRSSLLSLLGPAEICIEQTCIPCTLTSVAQGTSKAAIGAAQGILIYTFVLASPRSLTCNLSHMLATLAGYLQMLQERGLRPLR